MPQPTASSKSIYLFTSDYSGRFKRLGHVERDREGGLFAKTRLTLLCVQLRICYTGLAVFFLECLCSVAANLASSLQIESPSFHAGLQFHQLLSAAALGLHSSFKHMQEKFKISVHQELQIIFAK